MSSSALETRSWWSWRSIPVTGLSKSAGWITITGKFLVKVSFAAKVVNGIFSLSEQMLVLGTIVVVAKVAWKDAEVAPSVWQSKLGPFSKFSID